MMYTLLLIILVLISLMLVGSILMQAGKGGGLAASFGGAGSSPDSLLGSRQASNILTRSSWWLGGLFLGLSFILSIASHGGRGPSSVLDDAFQTSAPVGAPVGGASQSIPLPGAVTGDSSTAGAGGTVPPTPPVDTMTPSPRP